MIVKPGGVGRPCLRHLGEARALAAEQVPHRRRRPRPIPRPRRRCSASRPCGCGRSTGAAVVAIGAGSFGADGAVAPARSVSSVRPDCTRGPRSRPRVAGRSRDRPAARLGRSGRTGRAAPASTGTIRRMTETSLDRPRPAARHRARARRLQREPRRRVDETESLGYFWVRFDGEPTPFEPGQYMTIGVMVDGKIVQRPYSVASPPVEAGTERLRVLRPARRRAARSRRCCGRCRSASGCG